jgi:hypothetical protein
MCVCVCGRDFCFFWFADVQGVSLRDFDMRYFVWGSGMEGET